MALISLIALVFSVALFLTGCMPLPDDEAAWVLQDLAAGEGDSRLKQRTPEPARRTVTYTVQGRTYRGHLYVPAQPALAGLVLVPGVAERGWNDPRLVAFATTLARVRFLVLVPDLPNLRALRVQAEDAQGVADAFVQLRARAEFPASGRAGIGAFSYAVGPAVLAALKPAINEQVDFVLGVGGYHDLNRVINFFTTGYFEQEERWRYMTPNSYGKWVFVYGNATLLSDPTDRTMLRRIAQRKLDNDQADIVDLTTQLTLKGQSLLNLLENRDPERTPALLAGLPAAIRAEVDALNLADKDLSRLRARLILLHGTDDNIIPYTETLALATSVPPGQSDVFLIEGLAHVDVQPLRLDRRSLWRAIGVLLAQRKDAGEED